MILGFLCPKDVQIFVYLKPMALEYNFVFSCVHHRDKKLHERVVSGRLLVLVKRMNLCYTRNSFCWFS